MNFYAPRMAPARPSAVAAQASAAVPVQRAPSNENAREACLCNMSLAMSYVLMQGWSQPYEPAQALARGTIFPELDLPVLAAGRA